MKPISDWESETEKRVNLGVSYFKQGYNCSQSVVLAFSDLYDMSEPFAARISASFGGGIGRMRETCGSACAMFMLAGLEVTDPDDSNTVYPITENPYPNPLLKQKDYEIVQKLAQEFRAQTGSIICRELLGLNKKRADGTIPEIPITSVPDARTDDYYKKRPCIRMVQTAIRIYMDYLKEKASTQGKQ